VLKKIDNDFKAMKKPTPDAGQKPLRPAVIRKNTVTSPEKNNKPASRSFFIVGLGASAGGLEALEQFLSHVPKQCGLGFVVVQHLDPSRKGVLVELLQRNSAMPVVQIKDRMKIEREHRGARGEAGRPRQRSFYDFQFY
jgi:chemotaxis response regulator CheB